MLKSVYMNKTITILSIIIALLIGLVVGIFVTQDKTPKMIPDFQETPSAENVVNDLHQNNSNSSQEVINRQENTSDATFNIYNKSIKYNPEVWELEENRYCTPAMGSNGLKHDGTPCDLIGFMFKYRANTMDGSDNIVMGGRQPMSCSQITNATRCEDRFALVTSSDNPDVFRFYDYILDTLLE